MRRLAIILGLFCCIGLVGCSSDTKSGSEGDLAEPDGVVQDSGTDQAVEPDAPGIDAQETKPWPAFEPVVFAILTDIHIDGNLETGTAKKVKALLATAVAATPSAEFLALTGALTETVQEPVDLTEGSRMHTLKTLLTETGIPAEGCMGNHDFYAVDDLLYEFTSDRDAREELFKQEFGIEPWYYTIHGGTKFVYLNAMHGELWADSLGLNGSMGAQQLAWLDAELSDGKPAVLFLHHPPASVLEVGDLTLPEVISQHAANVLAVFVGHVHVFAREEIGGVPVYVTEAGYKGKSFHHVRVDPAAGTIEILNAADIDYGETTVFECPGETEAPLPPMEVLQGKILEIRIPDAHIVPLGLGTYLRDMVASIPMAMSLDGTMEAGTMRGLLTTGSFQGDPEGDKPAYIKAVKQADCVELKFTLQGGCFTTAPVDFRVDLAKLLGLPLPQGWLIRADFKDLELAGQLAADGTVQGGSLKTKLDLSIGLEDVKDIIVSQYCAGKLSMCKPGIKGMPQCPEGAGPEFFATLPQQCDVEIVGVGLRMVFAILKSIPEYTVELDANFTTFAAEPSATAQAGAADPALFATGDGGTCPAP